jgi:hypothetical protein
MRWVSMALVGLAAALLVTGLALSGLINAAFAVAGFGLLWLAGLWRGISWPGAAGPAVFVCLAAYGALQKVAMVWLLPALLIALAAWDLGVFQRHLARAAHIRQEETLKRVHYLRLIVVLGLGLGLSQVTLRIQTSLNFIWAIALGLVVVFGLSRTVRFMRREGEG